MLICVDMPARGFQEEGADLAYQSPSGQTSTFPEQNPFAYARLTVPKLYLSGYFFPLLLKTRVKFDILARINDSANLG